MTRLLVVGVGSAGHPTSVLSWAAAEARPGLDVLHVVHSYRQLGLSGTSWPPIIKAKDSRRLGARRVVSAAVTALRTACPGVEVDGSAIEGDPIAVLSDMSQLVDLVFVEAPSGADQSREAVAMGVAVLAACPVVVTPAAAPAPESDGRPVTLVLDGAELVHDALEFAFSAAQRRRTSLVVAVCGGSAPHRDTRARERFRNWETETQEMLDLELANWQSKYIDVALVAQLRTECAAAVADGLGKTSQLLVLARSMNCHGALSNALTKTICHPRCPVAVVPDA